ncbi:hypothetical protein MMC08_005947 [Hypocenomyce scalaris]|nr:hypothetical protein [Hypocenomyce scalaris]
MSLDKDYINSTWKRRQFQTVRLYALHYIRQSRWDDAEPLLLQAKSLEEPFCSRLEPCGLLKALEQFHIGSGREAGAIPLTQRTHDTEVQSPQRMPNNPPQETRTFEPADALVSVGLSEFQQPLEEIDWSGFRYLAQVRSHCLGVLPDYSTRVESSCGRVQVLRRYHPVDLGRQTVFSKGIVALAAEEIFSVGGGVFGSGGSG